MGRLDGKVAVITGGSSGIGLATAELFRNEGARVAVTGMTQESLNHAREVLGQDALVVCSNAGSLADIDSLISQIKERMQKIDVLFLNAAVAKAAPLEQVSEALYDDMMDISCRGVFFAIQKALPLMEHGASIVVTTSITNQLGSPNFSVYGASKAALRSMVKSLALELIDRGIRINAISPGPIATSIFDRFGLPSEVVQHVKTEIERKSPIKRFGKPDEIAKVALFLASDDSSYIVGEEIVVDGGMSLL